MIDCVTLTITYVNLYLPEFYTSDVLYHQQFCMQKQGLNRRNPHLRYAPSHSNARLLGKIRRQLYVIIISTFHLQRA